ncbi:calcium-binding protein [Nitrosomonas supralitoralis]|uniref:Hemolysin expression modulating protein n=1 Tax=Nitrosomonas supralitoralis TaxID=2116706 RepID=A0A2P7NTQ9_9PROT|nr:hemolysin expression modulating protein [Nitrosomonas supralitoralis]PSJ16819.1 hemolysin expression modulating protein [Nitrosomonas supralitoralis]
MSVTTTARPNLGSGSVKFIDGVPFEGIGSSGFDENDLLIIGDEQDNILTGGSGNDEIEGGAGNDTIKEGPGNGILRGGDGDDILDGQEGTELLFGGNGNDILLAGGSISVGKDKQHGDFDRLNGGAGNDTFGFYGVGNFQIADFKIGEDRLFFDSEKLGINSVPELVSYITNIEDNGDSGFTAEFVGGAAYIELVGVNFHSITADMVVFTL